MKNQQLEQFFRQNDFDFPDKPSTSTREKISKKEIDIFCREILNDKPELKKEIQTRMTDLQLKNIPMPVIHITSDTVTTPNNQPISTNFIENIQQNGFRKKDTNVCAFVKRKNSTSIAQPEFFKNHPEELIKNTKLFLQRYIHHGIRTNKQKLGELKNSGKANPVAIIIDGNLQLKRGSDYDNHHTLINGATSEQIINIIPLKDHCNHLNKEDIVYLTNQILKSMLNYYTEQNNNTNKKSNTVTK